MVIVRVQHHKVSFLSYLDTADAVGPVQGGGSVQREGGYGFFDTHLHIDTCQRKGQRDRTGETTAGVEVSGQCYGTARINHLAPAGIRLFQGKGGKREQCGNHAFIRHGTDVGIGSMQQVVGGDGGEFRSQPRTAQRYDFIGVEFQCQSHFTGGGQQAAGLSDREHALLAKDIAKLCQPVLNNGGHDFTDNEIHVIVRASIVFLRHCMRAQKRRNDVHTLVLVIVQTAHHTELQQLGFLVQAVAALALDSGNSHSAHLLQEALCLGAQLDKVALTRSFHRTDNAAATLHNGHIALAFQPPGEFLGTFPAKHEVRMRIDKAGQKALAAGVVMPVALIIAVALLATVRAYVGDDASGNFHRSVIDDAKFFHFPAAAGGKADGSYDTGIEDYQIFCHSCFCFIFFRLLAQSVYSCTHSIIRASSTCCIEKFSSPR
jgi:hypothetical protein